MKKIVLSLITTGIIASTYAVPAHAINNGLGSAMMAVIKADAQTACNGTVSSVVYYDNNGVKIIEVSCPNAPATTSGSSE